MTSYETGASTGTHRPSSTSTMDARPTVHRHNYTETKSAWMTTEFWAYLLTVAGVIVASLVNDSTDGGVFGAERAAFYISLLTIGYMISRGLAKAGSREPSDDDSDNRR